MSATSHQTKPTQTLSDSRLTTIITVSLAVLVMLVVILNIDDLLRVIGDRYLELIVYALITAFALFLSVPLANTQLSIAHAIGMVAFLSLSAPVMPAMTVAIFIGGIVGGGLMVTLANQRWRISRWHAIRTVVFVTSRVTLSFFVAGSAYLVLGLPLPINYLETDILNNMLPLTLYIAMYVVLYFAIFALQVHVESVSFRQMRRSDYFAIAIILLLPTPFAIIASDVARRDISLFFFTVTVIGIILIIFALYILSRSAQQLQRQLDEMRSIAAATQAMRGDLDLQNLLIQLYTHIAQLVPADNVTLSLRSSERAKFSYPVVIRQSQTVSTTVPDDVGLVAYVFKHQTALNIARDVQQQARALSVQPPAASVQAWLGLPMTVGDQTIGVFAVATTRPGVSYSDDDERLLNIILNSASIAIENARLYAQKSTRAEQLATLNQVSALLTVTLSPGEVLDTLVSSASTISEANAVAVYLYWDDDSGDEQALALVRSAGLSETFAIAPPQPLIIEQSSGDVWRMVPIMVDNAATHPAAQPYQALLAHENMRSWVELPLVIGGKMLGVIVLYFRDAQVFASEQLDLMQAFAIQAAQAVNNARTFTAADEALEQRVEQLFALAAMGRLLNAAMETNQIYDVVLTYATDATQSERGAIILKDTGERLRIVSQRGYPENVLTQSLNRADDPLASVLQTGQTHIKADTRTETDYVPLVPRTRAMLVMPILKGRQILGAILLENDQPNAYTDGDIQFVSQMMNQAVIAVDNTQLFQRIREARDNLQVILNTMDEGLLMIDNTQHIVLANPRVNLIGLTPDQLVNQPVHDLLNQPDLNLLERIGFANQERLLVLLDDLKTPSTWQGYPQEDYEVRTGQAVRSIQRQIIPVRDEHEHIMGVLLVFYDKTEEHTLNRAREALTQMIVHDLRSPLTAVTTSLRLLQELVPSDSDFAPIVEKTTDASRRAVNKVLSRVDALLDISKMESGEMYLEREPTPLAYIVDNVRAQLDPLAQELGINIRTSAMDNLPLLDVDSDKVERLILNLVDNALKYSPTNSAIDVRATVRGDDFVQIEVADHGPGIPDDYKDRLFDRFVQIEGRKAIRRGVGLGLTFCKLVTEAHGGRIWVEDNAPKEGATEDESIEDKNGDKRSGPGSVFITTLPIAHLQAPVD